MLRLIVAPPRREEHGTRDEQRDRGDPDRGDRHRDSAEQQ
jgi:hypothetical protein